MCVRVCIICSNFFCVYLSKCACPNVCKYVRVCVHLCVGVFVFARRGCVWWIKKIFDQKIVIISSFGNTVHKHTRYDKRQLCLMLCLMSVMSRVCRVCLSRVHISFLFTVLFLFWTIHNNLFKKSWKWIDVRNLAAFY